MIVGINKPKGPTSHDIINQVRRITGERRVGHAGTLDPMASGVLVVAIKRESTKLLNQIVDQDKEYVATVRLDGNSDTEDATGEITEIRNPKSEIRKVQIENVVNKFVGEIKQVPPIYSAIKVAGQKSYDMARRGKSVDLGTRDVVVHSIEVISFKWPELVIKVHCGKGVYIRSLGRDIGAALGVGGYLTSLERTRVGSYRIEDSLTIPLLEKFWMQESGKS